PRDASIQGLAYDSRTVRDGYLFFALPGIHDDGNRYIEAAIRAGATAIVHRGELAAYAEDVAYLAVADPRSAMSPIADAFYGYPSRDLRVIGVTGTEGKSTTVYLIYQLLLLAGKRAGFFSTVMSDTGRGEVPNPEHQTTPEATAVQRLLAEMRDAGMEYAIVEASSHGLSPRTSRLADVAFDVAVCMNVTHEHLEFHGTWEQYRSDKANLFRALDRSGHHKPRSFPGREVPAFGVISADDPSCGYFRAATGHPVVAFSSKGAPADLRARDIESDARGSSFAIEVEGRRLEARIELPGAFNVDNCLAALAAVSTSAGIVIDELLPLLPRIRPVRGRMTSIDRGQDFELLIDYAHTPSSFKAILPPLRQRARGRIIVVFGSAGERDTAKRPEQGRIAAEYCDIVILADEDPRGEASLAILEEIASGCAAKERGVSLFLIPDRLEALRRALALALPKDIVLFLGKGHENSIIYADRSMPWDEIANATALLAELGWGEGSQG
ncbi:MAG: UDP-N-acetylmuramoyl-L-alanyl-D-glutamate--2,6-diaminopimelate ligase, partial [Spirochaetota bacterium]